MDGVMSAILSVLLDGQQNVSQSSKCAALDTTRKTRVQKGKTGRRVKPRGIWKILLNTC